MVEQIKCTNQNLINHMISDNSQQLAKAYATCHALNKSHYENFPVASLLMPKRVRPAVDVIYAFSRTADDFADEIADKTESRRLLDEWEHHLDDQNPTHPIFLALRDVRTKYNLSDKPLRDLISAFRQDTQKPRYQNFSEVLDYCSRSANPVGRIILRLFELDTPRNLALSDAVCTALQLANFWQDVAVDLQKDRIYLPQDEQERFEVYECDLFNKVVSPNFIKLIQFQIERTRQIFRDGHAIGLEIGGRLGWELRLTWLGGWNILNAIEKQNFDTLTSRPTLAKKDFLRLAITSACRKSYRRVLS